VAGTALGLLLGGLFAGFLNLVKVPVPEGAQFFTMSDTLYFAFDFGKLIAASVVIVICTTAASLFPSLKAARMKPVTAMSHI
jgi:ABC-type lipoprotein release transport system permease subunit